MMITRRVLVRRVIAIVGGVGIDVHMAEDRFDVVGEDLRENCGGEPFGGVVEVECAREACDSVGDGDECPHVVRDDDCGEREFGADGVDE